MRLGEKQVLILQRLVLENYQTAADLSGTDMRPEDAAGVLKRLENRGLVRRIILSRNPTAPVSTYTTEWWITEVGRERLKTLARTGA